jgi:hypothetical protein
LKPKKKKKKERLRRKNLKQGMGLTQVIPELGIQFQLKTKSIMTLIELLKKNQQNQIKD